MTDDTLREECEALAYELYAVSAIHTYTDRLMAFARAQQAKAFKEAAVIADRVAAKHPAPEDWMARLAARSISEKIQAQATAREKGGA